MSANEVYDMVTTLNGRHQPEFGSGPAECSCGYEGPLRYHEHLADELLRRFVVAPTKLADDLKT